MSRVGKLFGILSEERDPEQVALLKKKREETLKVQPKWESLEKKLLSIGGEIVVPQKEVHLSELLSRGEEVKLRTRLWRGSPSNCHGNVSLLWKEKGSKGFKIYTGYGLSEDGLWRQHSWGTMNGTIIETTVEREKYFGFELSEEESKKFARDAY